MPDAVFVGLVVLQVVFALVMIAVMVHLVRVIRSQGGTIVPPQLSASVRRIFGRKRGSGGS